MTEKENEKKLVPKVITVGKNRKYITDSYLALQLYLTKTVLVLSKRKQYYLVSYRLLNC